MNELIIRKLFELQDELELVFPTPEYKNQIINFDEFSKKIEFNLYI